MHRFSRLAGIGAALTAALVFGGLTASPAAAVVTPAPSCSTPRTVTSPPGTGPAGNGQLRMSQDGTTAAWLTADAETDASVRLATLQMDTCASSTAALPAGVDVPAASLAISADGTRVALSDGVHAYTATLPVTSWSTTNLGAWPRVIGWADASHLFVADGTTERVATVTVLTSAPTGIVTVNSNGDGYVDALTAAAGTAYASVVTSLTTCELRAWTPPATSYAVLGRSARVLTDSGARVCTDGLTATTEGARSAVAIAAGDQLTAWVSDAGGDPVERRLTVADFVNPCSTQPAGGDRLRVLSLTWTDQGLVALFVAWAGALPVARADWDPWGSSVFSWNVDTGAVTRVSNSSTGVPAQVTPEVAEAAMSPTGHVLFTADDVTLTPQWDGEANRHFAFEQGLFSVRYDPVAPSVAVTAAAVDSIRGTFTLQSAAVGVQGPVTGCFFRGDGPGRVIASLPALTANGSTITGSWGAVDGDEVLAGPYSVAVTGFNGVVAVCTGCLNVQVPSAQNVSAIAYEQAAQVRWEEPAGDTYATRWEVSRASTPGVLATAVPGEGIYYRGVDLPAGVSDRLCVSAVDASGRRSTPACSAVVSTPPKEPDEVPPAKPANLKAVSVTSSRTGATLTATRGARTTRVVVRVNGKVWRTFTGATLRRALPRVGAGKSMTVAVTPYNGSTKGTTKTVTVRGSKVALSLTSRVVSRSSARVTATVKLSNGSVGKKVVYVEVSKNGKKWTTVKKARTSAHGKVTLKVTVHRGYKVHAYWKGAGATIGGTSNTRTVRR